MFPSPNSLTTVGRAQRQAGVVALQKQIEADGFDESYAPIVCLAAPDKRPREEVLAADTAKYRVIDDK